MQGDDLVSKKYFMEEFAKLDKILTEAGAEGDGFEAKIDSLGWLFDGDDADLLKRLNAYRRGLHHRGDAYASDDVEDVLVRLSASIDGIEIPEKIEETIFDIFGLKCSDKVADYYARAAIVLEQATGIDAEKAGGLAGFARSDHALISGSEKLRAAIARICDIRSDLLYRSRIADLFCVREAYRSFCEIEEETSKAHHGPAVEHHEEKVEHSEPAEEKSSPAARRTRAPRASHAPEHKEEPKAAEAPEAPKRRRGRPPRKQAEQQAAPAAPQKRGPGRPRKDAAAVQQPAPEKKRPGRKPAAQKTEAPKNEVKKTPGRKPRNKK